MLFDTDIFIWVQRGNLKAARLIDGENERLLSLFSYLKLLQGARDRKQLHYTRDFLKQYGFTILPLTENIGHRAAVYVESYGLSGGLRAADAVIAATAVEHGLTLCSGNAKNFRPVAGLKLSVFKP